MQNLTQVSKKSVAKKAIAKRDKQLVIACGALAKEIKFLLAQLGDNSTDLLFLPAILHNSPQKIVPELKKTIDKNKADYKTIFIGYADCGTGGLLDKLIADEQLQRLPGAHCYQFFAGMDEFEKMMEQELGSFFLTDYLARHFDELVWQGMGLAKHPELLQTMFGNYKKLVYLAQTDDDGLTSMAERASKKMALSFERRFTGYGLLQEFINNINHENT
ncbi:MAG: DUF1638 domain-containing protein [Hydrotalea sp.]|nr:DUF1638 domain-containing protein [Hydrotalea sp.]